MFDLIMYVLSFGAGVLTGWFLLAAPPSVTKWWADRGFWSRGP